MQKYGKRPNVRVQERTILLGVVNLLAVYPVRVVALVHEVRVKTVPLKRNIDTKKRMNS